MKSDNQYTGYKMHYFSLSVVLSLVAYTALAQKDTTRRQTIDITSSYKPVLRNAVKINFSATPLNADTTRPVFKYVIPKQNLFYSYQPITLKPLALQMDTSLDLGLRNYLKLGFGNFSTPYVSAGFSFGDGKKNLLNLYADYISSRGKIKNQDYTNLGIKATGSFFTPKNELYLGASLNQSDYYLYGYDHNIHNYIKDSIRQRFQDILLRAGLRNTVSGEYGISYDPNIAVSVFSNKDKLTESSLIVTAPVKKQFGDAFAINIEGKADITTYNTKGQNPDIKLNNNVAQVAASLVFSSPRFSINGGIIPTWDNGKFVWLPNVYMQAQLKEKVLMFQAGWVGRYTKNTYRYLSTANPYLLPVKFQLNTKEVEYYGGFKATAGKHFSFNTKAGFLTYNNLPFFINDTSFNGKGFNISNESRVYDLRLHGDINYIDQDKFTLTAGISFNGYTGMKDNYKAWNTLPMEINGSFRWWAFKQVLLKSDIYVFGGSNYLDKGNISRSFNGGTDLSAGVEFKITKMFSAWLDVNNILNDKYQRWHNYEVYGLNLLGGLRIIF